MKTHVEWKQERFARRELKLADPPAVDVGSLWERVGKDGARQLYLLIAVLPANAWGFKQASLWSFKRARAERVNLAALTSGTSWERVM